MIKEIEILANLWVKWNAKQISASDLAMAFHRYFPSECEMAWDRFIHPSKLAKKILAEMVKK